MIVFGIVVAVAVGAFIAGKVYGARVEADAIAAGIRLGSYAQTEIGAAYRTVSADIRADVGSLLARVKRYL
jgi:hypothetical protein